MFATHVRTKTRNTCTAMISTAISMFISMTYFLYVMMVRTSFSVFNCIEPLPKDGNQYMSDEPLEQCGKKGGLQDRLFIPALICIVLYCCILPLILYGIFHRNRKIIKKDQKLRAAKGVVHLNEIHILNLEAATAVCTNISNLICIGGLMLS